MLARAYTTLERRAHGHYRPVSGLLQPLLQNDGLAEQSVEAIEGSRIKVNGRWLLNFAATNYLGLAANPVVQKLASRAIDDWGISIGMPRRLADDRLSRRLEMGLAQLVGQEKALVFPSTTHIALDVLPLLAGRRGMLFVDEGAYPISLEGVALAAGRGARIRKFRHNNPQALYRLMRTYASVPEKVVVCDGVYGAEGQIAPLTVFHRLAQAFDAALYVDDAHGVGVIGSHPTRARPYGSGGRGTPSFFGLPPGNMAHVGSLGKGFGVPVAFVAGPAGFIDTLRSMASTHVHSSPPAIPVLAGALGALRVNIVCGDHLRRRLLNNVRRFRRNLLRAGIHPPGNPYLPIQSIHFASTTMAENFSRSLWSAGIWAVLQLQPPDRPGGAAVRFVLSAGHSKADIDTATSIVVCCLMSS